MNTRMHTLIECQTPDSKISLQTSKVDTGADGNLMPISMFSKLFPKISLETLGKMINKGIMLFAYSSTQIKQYGTGSVKLSFKRKNVICKFFVIEHETAIVGITDSEKLGLVKVNFDMVDKGVKVVNEITSEMF